MKERTAVALINQKGGVGKTTLAVILTEIALSRSSATITAIDLDPQKNFLSTLKGLEKPEEFSSRLVLSDKIVDQGDLMIIDCPPVIEKPTAEAIDFADVVLVPIRADGYSLLNLTNIYNLGDSLGKSKEQMPIVTVGFGSSSLPLQEAVNQQINHRGYCMAADLPLVKTIPLNITLGRFWETGLQMKHRHMFYTLFNDIVSAGVAIARGNIEQITWGEKNNA